MADFILFFTIIIFLITAVLLIIILTAWLLVDYLFIYCAKILYKIDEDLKLEIIVISLLFIFVLLHVLTFIVLS